ncbi:OmpA family protein [Sinimarinibacterium sp. CAU 1509]|uniref:OmpA family protein n=1 Tax=Sinimarinibacterium sp. CAU 1509 TaxID=2562283 RepID=UPI0010AC8D41|nr:OmpA family protein [Sinimarinibacterium sp. CAU 1509]TJY65064.1 OmpA family protein [Sinimarinibacterium sp. CAU 1509]
MHHLKKFAAVTGVLLAAPIAHAATSTEVYAPSYLSVLGMYTFTDIDGLADKPRQDYIDHGVGVHVLYGSMGEDGTGWGYELGGAHEIFETGSAVATDFYRSYLDLNLVYSFGDRKTFTPFFLIGGGLAYNDQLPDANDDWSGLANAGLGFVSAPITDAGKIRLRMEARYLYDWFQDEYEDVRVSAGIEIPLFLERTVEIPELEEQVKVVEVSTGLTDTDGDGVVDEKDQCPDTPAGDRVDGNGCTLPQIIELKGVTFEFNKTRLRPDAQTILDWAVEILKKYPDMQVEVAGHTDSIGSDEYNQKLSEGRAESVRAYFVEHGVPESQMTVKGYGESEPRDTNDTEEGRELNRRVELRVQN